MERERYVITSEIRNCERSCVARSGRGCRGAGVIPALAGSAPERDQVSFVIKHMLAITTT
jgi:hypothetical protein